MTEIPGLTCTCGSADLFSIQPGNDPVRSEMPLFDVLLDAGAPTVAFCRACAIKRFRGLSEVADA